MTRSFWMMIVVVACVVAMTQGRGTAAVEEDVANETVAGSASLAMMEVTTVVEDGEKLILATVTVDDQPIEDAAVTFYVQRTFGWMLIGADRTLDDGTAAVPFPSDLPGGPTGTLVVRAQITASPTYSGAQAQAVFDGVPKVSIEDQPQPRALWARRAPWSMVAIFVVVFVGVWSAYGYVFVQLTKIQKGTGIKFQS